MEWKVRENETSLSPALRGELAGVQHIRLQCANIFGFERENSDGLTIGAGEFNLRSGGAWVNMHDRTDISLNEGVVGNIPRQSDGLQFGEHLYPKGYAVTNRATFDPRSTIHMDRRAAFPAGPRRSPSTIYFIPNPVSW